MATVLLKRNIRTGFTSTKPNPDENFLKMQWEEETGSLNKAFENAAEISRTNKVIVNPMMKAFGLTQTDVDKMLKKDFEVSQLKLAEVEKALMTPPMDFTKLQKEDINLVMKNTQHTRAADPTYGVLWRPAYGGSSIAYNGESEEVPSATIDTAASRIDPKAQAWGEGWYDSDYSVIYAYLAFTFQPPTFGHLRLTAYPWLHGYYSLYSNDTWYKSEYARAELDTWMDVHQNYWRPKEFQRRFTMADDELHPERSGRIDQQYGIIYDTNVGEGDTVTVRVGVRLYCRGKANGGRAMLNFQSGTGNYVYVPYVQWYLYR